MAAASGRAHLARRHLQRIIGLANHLSKIIRASRVFICRILAAYRAAEGDQIAVGPHIKEDLRWFKTYLARFNGRSIIPTNRTVLRIWADACPKGAGASDGRQCYMHKFPHRVTNSHHINDLEALNCLAAVRKFVTPEHAGGTTEVHCDNRVAVDASTSGKARNEVLAACARAMWFHAAINQVDIKFTHVPGEAMALPDALSRAGVDRANKERARAFISDIPLRVVDIEEDKFDYSILYDFRPVGQQPGGGGLRQATPRP